MFAGYLRLASIWLAAGWPDRLVVTWLTIIHRGTWWATPLDPSPHSWALSNLRRWVISYNYGCQPATVCGKILQRESPEILGWLNMLKSRLSPWNSGLVKYVKYRLSPEKEQKELATLRLGVFGRSHGVSSTYVLGVSWEITYSNKLLLHSYFNGVL